MKNISFLLIVVWLSQVKGWSQPIIKRVQGNLSQSSVTKIIQDDLGFIWVGTRHGLNRYKGHEFDVFQPDDGEGASLSTSNITTLAKDKYGNIWIGTVDGGINFYDFKTGTFQAHRHDPDNENSPAEDLIMSMYADTLGYLYIGYQGGGMDVLDIQQQKYQHFKHDPQNVFSLPDNHIHSIEADEHGNLWVATNDAGIARFDYQGKKFYPYHLFDNQGNRIRTIRALHAKGNLLLAGTNNGIYKYNYLEHKFEQFATDDLINQNPVLSILIDSDEKILVGTENFGLFLIDQKKNEVVNLMERNSIWCIFQDKSQITWIGSYKNGLHKIDPFENYFENYRHEELAENSLSYNIVSSFIEDESGNLWVGTDGGGLNFLDLKKDNQYKLWTDENREQQYISSKAILDLLYDDDQNLYVATWKGGVNVLEHGKSKFSIINEENGLLGNNTYDFIKDQNGLIWILSFVEGLSIYNPKNKKFDYIRSQELGSSALRTIIEDFNHNFWIGTEGQGLIKIKVDSLNNIIEKKSFTNNNKQQIISNNLITYVYQCSDSIIWVGTEGGGLNKYNKENNSFITYTESDGLASNLIYGIIEDDLGYIWISTLKGLSRFDKNNNTFKNYRVSNNNGSVEFFKGACYKLKNGELLFGSIEGYYKFNPKDIVNNLTIPKVYITSIQVNGENISEKYSRNASLIDQLDLDYSENDIDLSYSALSYSEPEKTQFEYKMVGYDKEWSKVTNRHEVNYTNLPPGAYRFIIKASNNDDLWNKEGANLIINISEPWWNTLWAYIGYFLLIIAAIWYGRQLIIYREKLKNDLKIEHLELMKMQEVDELKSKFFTNISHEFRTPLTLLLGPLKVLMESEQNKNASKHYHTMHRNANKLLRLINEILELSKLESGSTKVQFVNSDIVDFIKPIALSFTEMAERKYIDYQCSFPDNPAHIYFDKTKVEKVILNVLSNAFKNTAEFGKIRFQLADSSHEIFIEIEDSGKGIPPEHLNHIFDRFYQVDSKAHGTGIGLALTKELVELHKGIIEVESKEGKGTIFRIKFLKGSTHISQKEILEKENKNKTKHISDYDQIDLEDIYKDQPEEEFTKDLEAPTLLIVEDNKDMRKFIVEQLQETYQILEAVNGKEGLQVAQRQNPDIIVSDVMMPEMNGLEFCRKIKEDKNTSHISVILLTAKASSDSIESGLETGADYYMTKPFSPRLLELRVKNILHTREQVRKHILNGPDTTMSPKEIKISSRDQEFLKKIREYIENHMADSNFGIDNLCNEFGMSRTQLFRKLKALVGQSATEFIRSFRLKRAAQLLRSEEFTVSEVTYKVGFNDLKYFRNCFKKQFGVNPSEYIGGKA